MRGTEWDRLRPVSTPEEPGRSQITQQREAEGCHLLPLGSHSAPTQPEPSPEVACHARGGGIGGRVLAMKWKLSPGTKDTFITSVMAFQTHYGCANSSSSVIARGAASARCQSGIRAGRCSRNRGSGTRDSEGAKGNHLINPLVAPPLFALQSGNLTGICCATPRYAYALCS